MRTRQQLRQEFPELNEDQILTAHQYLEIIHPKSAEDPDFRQLVANSIEPNGNLFRLRRVLELPLP